MLLEALVACAGVTLKAVATALGIALKDAKLTAEGDLDFRGTLGVAKDAPVGFREIRLKFDLDSDASEEQLKKLIELTERYCVVMQTIRGAPPVVVSRERSGQHRRRRSRERHALLLRRRSACASAGASTAAIELLGIGRADLPAREGCRHARRLPAATKRDYARHWTPVHLDFAVGDLPRAVARAKAAGASLEEDIEAKAWGRIAMLSDPFGNGFCLLEFTGRGYDEIV